jgi:hypothetical protein
MRTIHKYTLEISDKIQIESYKFAEILSVQVQNGTPVLWALVDTDNAKDKITLAIIGTGNPFWPIDYLYIDTFQLSNGLVFHVFEVSPIENP